jgi:hypothetical protein
MEQVPSSTDKVSDMGGQEQNVVVEQAGILEDAVVQQEESSH